MKTVLSVNLNKIALIRNSRGRDYPSVKAFGRRALQAGAGGVTIHPRPDQRHARYSDIADLSELVKEFADAELNIEGYPEEELIEQVLRYKPHQFTLVPDKPDQITSDHGWDLNQDGEFVTDIVRKVQAAGVRVSLFMDPDEAQIKLAQETGAKRIELYTEEYAHAYGAPQFDAIAAKYLACARYAVSLGLTVNAGHDLNLENLAPLVAEGTIAEVSIGHALTVEALEMGFDQVIQKYVEILS
ncbi:Pyridoxal phosphate biosynthesis protein [Hahella chejuensis KCTC 2396]|uniref:Pyridoxine 5'-phosphate synthase n=1 Tax=Hahella chejuensis (strain KCTC 2396) TaxID=349521 RepID=Q2SQM4_HAHCH|nr:pyridoxine 5'-phosphate synthase [Hahella chejuensis]ABC27050.1 Pyridoxal phosphate biosynthesis protein [Hahella chejuensis KCTC 2396]